MSEIIQSYDQNGNDITWHPINNERVIENSKQADWTSTLKVCNQSVNEERNGDRGGNSQVNGPQLHINIQHDHGVLRNREERNDNNGTRKVI